MIEPTPLSNTLSFAQMTAIRDEASYKVHKDRYVGQIDPVTKLRHGFGVYTYQENPFFQYQGYFDNGIKQTQDDQASTFLLRDGTSITG
jgi:hypothetical protein